MFRETDRISKTESNSVDIKYLVWVGMYLKARIELLREEDEYYWNVKEFLCISFFELANNIRIIKEGDYFLGTLCKIVFKTSQDHNYIKHFCYDGIIGLKKVKFHQINNFYTVCPSPGHLQIYDLYSCYKLLFENKVIDLGI